MKTTFKKTIASAALAAALFSICLSANANPTVSAVSDTGKMSKMKMDKMSSKKKKKMDKMSGDKMKMKKDSSKM